MRLRICGALLAVLICQTAWTQNAPAGKAGQREMQGLPPRAVAADYQAHAQAGNLTVGAEFTAHSVPTADSIFSTEDYVMVEIGLYGPAGTRISVSGDNFSIRINGKKPTPAEPYEMAFKSLKDPTWLPPVPVEPQSKGGLTGGGGGQGKGEDPPPPPHMTLEERRAMEKKVRSAALPVGELPSPQAGLLFFPYSGEDNKIRQVELIYSGPAGKATLSLHP